MIKITKTTSYNSYNVPILVMTHKLQKNKIIIITGFSTLI